MYSVYLNQKEKNIIGKVLTMKYPIILHLRSHLGPSNGSLIEDVILILKDIGIYSLFSCNTDRYYSVSIYKKHKKRFNYGVSHSVSLDKLFGLE